MADCLCRFTNAKRAVKADHGKLNEFLIVCRGIFNTFGHPPCHPLPNKTGNRISTGGCLCRISNAKRVHVKADFTRYWRSLRGLGFVAFRCLSHVLPLAAVCRTGWDSVSVCLVAPSVSAVLRVHVFRLREILYIKKKTVCACVNAIDELALDQMTCWPYLGENWCEDGLEH